MLTQKVLDSFAKTAYPSVVANSPLEAGRHAEQHDG